jgi:D-alanine-D-alanine ligase
VLVLAGGDSPEREVSLQSGEGVVAGLQQAGFEVTQLDPARTSVRDLSASDWDIAFPVVHGTGGEDGRLQQDLAAIGLAYVGSSAASSELTFDKIATRQRMTEYGIAVADAVVVSAGDDIPAAMEACRQLGPAVVVKPARQGSSVGVSIVRSHDRLADAVTAALRFDDVCLIERFIAGRELTVAIVDDEILPAVEIVVADDWYDYHAKYSDDRTQYVVSPENIPASLGEMARQACRACDVSGIARVDFRLDPDGNAWLLEINSVPGMTSHSLVPKAAATLGMSMGDLCGRCITHALKRTAAAVEIQKRLRA